MTTWVSLRSSVAGSSRAPGFQRAHSASVTCRQRVAGAQHLAAHQMGGQIAVAESEPVRLHAVGGEFLLGVPGFVACPQPRSGSIPPPRVYMQVSRSGQIRTPCIQASSPTLTIAVSSWSSEARCRAGELAEAQQLLDTEQEAGAADAADQNRDLHTDRH